MILSPHPQPLDPHNELLPRKKKCCCFREKMLVIHVWPSSVGLNVIQWDGRTAKKHPGSSQYEVIRAPTFASHCLQAPILRSDSPGFFRWKLPVAGWLQVGCWCLAYNRHWTTFLRCWVCCAACAPGNVEMPCHCPQKAAEDDWRWFILNLRILENITEIQIHSKYPGSDWTRGE